MRAIIFDGYVDEPSCLGVPPYLSTYPRYLAGAMEELGWEWTYVTVDEWRLGRSGAGATPGRGGGGKIRHRRGRDDRGGAGGGAGGIAGRGTGGTARGARRGRPGSWSREAAAEKWKDAGPADVLVALWGAIVPGKYLTATPASPRELGELASSFSGRTLLGGPGTDFIRRHHPGVAAAFDSTLGGDADASLFALGSGERADPAVRRSADQRRKWSVAGAAVAGHHPDAGGPLVAEMESYRGCVRFLSGGCSFCSDVGEGAPEFRSPGEVGEEAAALAGAGVENFRMGGQTCIFSYGAKGVGESETPEPEAKAVDGLLAAVREGAPRLRVLHTDNANPAVIAAHPEASLDVARAIARRCTPGNVVALGLESADPAVREANNLNASAEDAMSAVRIINEAGGERGGNGMPNLLPGINFVTGLPGETAGTVEMNMEFLRGLLGEGLMVRRVNVRRALMPGSPRPSGSLHHRKFRDMVTEVFEPPMLARVVPAGTVMRDVFLETARGNLTFGRQPGSYPLLVGLPYDAGVGRRVDVLVTSHGSRSVGGVEYPLPVNTASLGALCALPGVGKKRAAAMVRGRPFGSFGEFAAVLDSEELARDLQGSVTFEGRP